MIFSQIHLCNVARQVVRVNEPLQLGENVLTEQFGDVTLTHTFNSDWLISSGNGEYIYAISNHTIERDPPEEEEEEGENAGQDLQ